MLTVDREGFNRGFDVERARRIRAEIVAVAGEEISFPLSSTPVFVGRGLAEQLTGAVAAFFAAVRRPSFQERAARWVPDRYRVGGDLQGIPQVSQFDFALGRDAAGELKPHLLECQGCSSLMGIVPWYGELLCSRMLPGYTPFLSHDGWEAYRADLTAVLGDSVLIDVETPIQRLRADFWVLRHFARIEVADLAWRTLCELREGQRRVYCRVVPVEAERSGCDDVFAGFCRQRIAWVSNPDWFFMLGKRALPMLREVSDLVPETSELTAESAAGWSGRVDFVLKPCNDFGGSGVNLDPGPADLERALASGEPHVLQERIALEPVVQPPDGPPLFCDLRVLCLADRPVSLLCRLARDRMCNIGRNQQYPWCGITVGLMPLAADPVADFPVADLRVADPPVSENDAN